MIPNYAIAALTASYKSAVDYSNALANGTNVPEGDYWRNYGLEANVLVRAYSNPASFTGSYDSENWPILERNSSISYSCFLEADWVAHAPVPGVYVITVPPKVAVKLEVDGVLIYQVGAIIQSISPASASANSFNGNQIENLSSEPMRIEFNFPESTTRNRQDGIRPVGTHYLKVGFMYQGASGTSVSVNEFRVFHKDDENSINAGWRYTERLLNYIKGASSAAPLRVMPLFCPNTMYVEDVADLPPQSKNSRSLNVSSISNSPIGTRGSTKLRAASPEDFAELAYRCNRPLWISLPPMMSDATLAAFFTRLHTELTRLYGGVYPTKVHVEPSNELWNGSFPSNYGFLSEVYQTKISEPSLPTLLANKSNAYVVSQSCGAHFALRAWKIAEEILGRQRIVRTFGCQVAFYEGGASVMLEYVDPGIIQQGVKVGNLVDIVTVAPYFNTYGDTQLQTRNDVIKNTTAYLSANLSQYVPQPRGVDTPTKIATSNNAMTVTDRIRYRYYQDGANSKTASQWLDGVFRNGLDWNGITCRYFISKLRLAGFTACKVGIYEINSHDDFCSVKPSTQDPYGLVCNYIGGVFTPLTLNDPILSSGEIVRVLPLTDVTGTVGGSFSNGVNFKAKVKPDGTVTLHASQFDYDNDIPSTGTITGTVVLANITRLDALHDFQIEWLWYTLEGNQYLRDVSSRMKDCGFEVACWFFDGGYTYSFNSGNSLSRVQSSPWTAAKKGVWNTGIGHNTWKVMT